MERAKFRERSSRPSSRTGSGEEFAHAQFSSPSTLIWRSLGPLALANLAQTLSHAAVVLTLSAYSSIDAATAGTFQRLYLLLGTLVVAISGALSIRINASVRLQSSRDQGLWLARARYVLGRLSVLVGALGGVLTVSISALTNLERSATIGYGLVITCAAMALCATQPMYLELVSRRRSLAILKIGLATSLSGLAIFYLLLSTEFGLLSAAVAPLASNLLAILLLKQASEVTAVDVRDLGTIWPIGTLKALLADAGNQLTQLIVGSLSWLACLAMLTRTPETASVLTIVLALVSIVDAAALAAGTTLSTITPGIAANVARERQNAGRQILRTVAVICSLSGFLVATAFFFHPIVTSVPNGGPSQAFVATALVFISASTSAYSTVMAKGVVRPAGKTSLLRDLAIVIAGARILLVGALPLATADGSYGSTITMLVAVSLLGLFNAVLLRFTTRRILLQARDGDLVCRPRSV